MWFLRRNESLLSRDFIEQVLFLKALVYLADWSPEIETANLIETTSIPRIPVSSFHTNKQTGFHLPIISWGRLGFLVVHVHSHPQEGGGGASSVGTFQWAAVSWRRWYFFFVERWRGKSGEMMSGDMKGISTPGKWRYITGSFTQEYSWCLCHMIHPISMYLNKRQLVP